MHTQHKSLVQHNYGSTTTPSGTSEITSGKCTVAYKNNSRLIVGNFCRNTNVTRFYITNPRQNQTNTTSG